MLAFAANSILCRMALEARTIDAASFTAVRLVSGALMLWLVMVVRHGVPATRAEPLAVLTLFLYATCFSFAHLSLTASTGTLILFASVQLTRFVAGMLAGERMAPLAGFGFFLALAGFVWLVSPGVSAPSLHGAVASGLGYVAWYAALQGLTATRAATLQICVPVFAAIGGVLLLAEPVDQRLILSSVAVLGGITLTLGIRQRTG
jgi:drug/metabolite transporter (DMT)-like permease